MDLFFRAWLQQVLALEWGIDLSAVSSRNLRSKYPGPSCDVAIPALGPG